MASLTEEFHRPKRNMLIFTSALFVTLLPKASLDTGLIGIKPQHISANSIWIMLSAAIIWSAISFVFEWIEARKQASALRLEKSWPDWEMSLIEQVGILRRSLAEITERPAPVQLTTDLDFYLSGLKDSLIRAGSPELIDAILAKVPSAPAVDHVVNIDAFREAVREELWSKVVLQLNQIQVTLMMMGQSISSIESYKVAVARDLGEAIRLRDQIRRWNSSVSQVRKLQIIIWELAIPIAFSCTVLIIAALRHTKPVYTTLIWLFPPVQ